MSRSRSLLLRSLVVLLLTLLLAPLVSINPPGALAKDGPAGGTPSGILSSPKEPCSIAQFDTLRAALDTSRGAWVTRLAPKAYAKFSDARNAYVKYVTRCAKKLNLNLQEAMQNVTAYDAPAKASGGQSDNGYVPRNPNAPTYTPPVASTIAPPPAKTGPFAPFATGLLFDGSPGTAAPPSALGTYSMTVFPADPRAVNADADGVNSPLGGALQFSNTLDHLRIAGGSWATWSNGYQGDVYLNLGTSLTMYMPPDTRAFYFYAQANDLGTFDFTATANDGTSSYPVSITSPSGAKYFGFYAPLAGADLSSITVSCPDCGGDGFAVGEFGIHQNSGADLRLTKFSEPHDVVPAGSVFTYTIYVDNLGPDIAHQVVVTDTLLSSSDISIQSCAFSVSQGGGAITQFTCTTGNLVSTQFGTDIGTFATNSLDPLSPSSQGRLRASFRLVANIAIDVTNTTRVSSNTFDPNLNNNFAEDEITVTPVVDLQANSVFGAEVQTNGLAGKVVDTNALPAMPDPVCCNFGGTTVTAGRRLQWNTSTINAGPSPAENVEIQVLLPYGTSLIENTLTGVPITGTVTGHCMAEPAGAQRTKAICDYGEVLPGQTASLRFQLLVDPSLPVGTQLSIDSIASSDQFDKNTSNNITSIQFDSNAWGDLAISKTANGAAITDGTFFYEYDVSNKGPSWSRDVTLSDALPPEVDFVNAFIDPEGDGDANPLQCTAQAGTLLCPLGDIKPTGTQPIKVYANVHVKAGTPDGTNISDTVTLKMDTPDPFLSDNTDSLIVAVASQDLILTKTAPASAGAGEEITYNLAVNNSGPMQANTVQVMDYLPAQFKLLTLTPDQGSCQAGVEGDPLRPTVCDLGDIPSNTTVNIAVFGQVRSDTLGDTLLFNDAQVTGDVPETTLANNVDTVTTAVVATCGVIPAKPVTISPPDGKVTKKAFVLLDWSDVNCAVHYRVVVRQDSINAPNFIAVKHLPVSQYTTDPLPREHDYFWRGIACNGTGCKRSAWSKFRVITAP